MQFTKGGTSVLLKTDDGPEKHRRRGGLSIAKRFFANSLALAYDCIILLVIKQYACQSGNPLLSTP